MAQAAFSLAVDFESLTCCECGVPFAAPRTYISERRCDHRTFFCVNGHPQYFPAESKEEALRKQLAAEEQRRFAALTRANEAEAANLKLQRKLKRVGRGVCPECNRTFQDLARHMNCKHAEKVTA